MKPPKVFEGVRRFIVVREAGKELGRIETTHCWWCTEEAWWCTEEAVCSACSAKADEIRKSSTKVSDNV